MNESSWAKITFNETVNPKNKWEKHMDAPSDKWINKICMVVMRKRKDKKEPLVLEMYQQEERKSWGDKKLQRRERQRGEERPGTPLV